MPFDNHKNFAYSTVATAPTPADSGTSLTVETGHGSRFPTAPFNATVWPVGDQPTVDNAEIVRVTVVTGDVLTIARAQEGTSARSVVVGDQIAATITAKTLTDIEGTVGVATQNLVVENNSAAPNSKVDLTVDKIAIGNALVSGVSVTVDIDASGANGLDTGLKAPNTWYFVWLIYNPVSIAVAGLLSTSSTAPTMPSGYTLKRRVGAVRTDASSNFLKFRQIGDFLTYENEQRVLTTGTATTFTAVNCAASVPTTSRRAYISELQQASAGNVIVRRTGSGANGFQISNIGSNIVAGRFFAFVNLDSSQRFDYKVNNAAVQTTIDVLGYLDPVL